MTYFILVTGLALVSGVRHSNLFSTMAKFAATPVFQRLCNLTSRVLAFTKCTKAFGNSLTKNGLFEPDYNLDWVSSQADTLLSSALLLQTSLSLKIKPGALEYPPYFLDFTMKSVPLTAAAILTFIVTPTRTEPLTPTILNQTGVAIQVPGPVPISVSVEDLIIPSPFDSSPTERISNGLSAVSQQVHFDDESDEPTMATNDRYHQNIVHTTSRSPDYCHGSRPTKPALISEIMVGVEGNKLLEELPYCTDRRHRDTEGQPKFHPGGMLGGHGPVVHHTLSEHQKPSAMPNAQRMQSQHVSTKFIMSRSSSRVLGPSSCVLIPQASAG